MYNSIYCAAIYGWCHSTVISEAGFNLYYCVYKHCWILSLDLWSKPIGLLRRIFHYLSDLSTCYRTCNTCFYVRACMQKSYLECMCVYWLTQNRLQFLALGAVISKCVALLIHEGRILLLCTFRQSSAWYWVTWNKNCIINGALLFINLLPLPCSEIVA